MRNYTEPKLEIVTLEVSDVITTSGVMGYIDNTVGANEDGGHASISAYEI